MALTQGRAAVRKSVRGAVRMARRVAGRPYGLPTTRREQYWTDLSIDHGASFEQQEIQLPATQQILASGKDFPG
jgi:hypothetical protein